MITAISPAITGFRSNYNVNFGQLRPQNQILKNYQGQTNSKNPSFEGDAGCLIMGLASASLLVIGVALLHYGYTHNSFSGANTGISQKADDAVHNGLRKTSQGVLYISPKQNRVTTRQISDAFISTASKALR